MKIKTYLNAMETALWLLQHPQYSHTFKRRARQCEAFRARILEMDAEKDEQEAMLRLTIDELRNEIDEKDAKIDDLDVLISILHGAIDRS